VVNLRNIINKLWRNKDNLDSKAKCFCEDQDCESPFDYIDRGIFIVPLNKIIGSVGKCNDFNSQFKPKSHVPPDRLNSLKQALWKRKSLPPVKLYKVKDEYYVVDGNHRIAAARELGRSDIMAKIVELTPSNNT